MLTALVCLSAWAVAAASPPSSGVPPTILFDGNALAESRARAATDLAGAIAAAIQQLLAAADAKLSAGPFTVLNKTIVPPTGDVHDYLSTQSYGWPCTATCTPTVLNYTGAGSCARWCYGSNGCNWSWVGQVEPGEPPEYPCNRSTGLPWVSHSGFAGPQVELNNRRQADGM